MGTATFHKLFLVYCFIKMSTSWCLKTTFAGIDEMNSIDISPDGNRILTGDKSGRVTVYDTASLKIKYIYDFPTEVYSAKYSKDQTMIAIAGIQNDVYVLDADTYSQITTITTDHIEVYEIDFSYDNTRIIACGKNKHSSAWQVSDWSQIYDFNVYHEAFSCKFGDNGHMIVSDSNGDAYTYNENGAQYYRFFPGGGGAISV